MNTRKLLIITLLTAASGAAVAGKAPVIVGGFQISGIATPPVSLNAAVNAAGEKREATKEDEEKAKDKK